MGVPQPWLKNEVKLRTGQFSAIHTSPTFGVVPQLKSTAFAAMDEIEFTAFRKLAVEVLFTDFCRACGARTSTTRSMTSWARPALGDSGRRAAA